MQFVKNYRNLQEENGSYKVHTVTKTDMKSKYTKNHDPLQAANFSRVSTQQQMNPIVTIS